MSESGSLFCSNDVENLIVNEIERKKGSKQQSVVVSAIDFIMKHDKLAWVLNAGH